MCNSLYKYEIKVITNLQQFEKAALFEYSCSKNGPELLQLCLIPEASDLAVRSWCQWCDVCVSPWRGSAPEEWWSGPHPGANEYWRVTGPRANSNEATMWPAAGGGQTEQRSPYETLTSPKSSILLLFRNLSLLLEQNTVAVSVRCTIRQGLNFHIVKKHWLFYAVSCINVPFLHINYTQCRNMWYIIFVKKKSNVG